MIIRKNSPLRRIPSKLNIKQTLFLDAIRYSMEMADTSYIRLKRTLRNLTTKQLQKRDSTIISSSMVHALIDAWSIVDTVHRLRWLLTSMPGVVKGSPGRIIFMNNTITVVNLRHIIQHLNKKDQIEELIETKSAALGTLTWSVVSDTAPDEIYSCYLRSGTLPTITAPFVISTKSKRYPIDNIMLSIGNEAVCLSDIMDHLARLVKSIEKGLKSQFRGLQPAINAVFIILKIKME